MVDVDASDEGNPRRVPDRVPDAGSPDGAATPAHGGGRRDVGAMRSAGSATSRARCLERGRGSRAFRARTAEAMMAEVRGWPCSSTPHVDGLGEGTARAVRYADHVQLRQGAQGRTQLHGMDDPAGVVDFAAVTQRSTLRGYSARLSVEIRTFQKQGDGPIADPRGWGPDIAGKHSGVERARAVGSDEGMSDVPRHARSGPSGRSGGPERPGRRAESGDG